MSILALVYMPSGACLHKARRPGAVRRDERREGEAARLGSADEAAHVEAVGEAEAPGEERRRAGSGDAAAERS